MQTLITLMAIGIAALNAALAVCILLIFKRSSRSAVLAWIRRYALLIVFLLSLLSVAGSLTLQYAGNFPPCIMCWWQRIFLYPVVLISGVAYLKNARFSDVADYVLALSIPGALVALYQHLLQMLPAGALIPCSASNDCAIRSIFEFGYITLPWMALSVFAVLIYVALAARKGS